MPSVNDAAREFSRSCARFGRQTGAQSKFACNRRDAPRRALDGQTSRGPVPSENEAGPAHVHRAIAMGLRPGLARLGRVYLSQASGRVSGVARSVPH